VDAHFLPICEHPTVRHLFARKKVNNWKSTAKIGGQTAKGERKKPVKYLFTGSNNDEKCARDEILIFLSGSAL
jgi:hypothetical protein